MPTDKAAIAEALQSLDHADDTLWTDDGAPRVDAVQRITNDDKITRAQINDALPGFVRKGTDSVTEPPDDDETAGIDPGVIQPVAKNTTIVAAPPEGEGLDLDPDQEYERLRLIAKGRVDDANEAVAEAKSAIADAQQNLRAAEGRLTRALTLYSARYPAISVAANIKQHLERQQEILRERVTGSKLETLNPIDAVMQQRRRNGGRAISTVPYLPRKAAVNY